MYKAVCLVVIGVYPSAGKQFVKGTIETGETLDEAAERELREESELTIQSPLVYLGQHQIRAELSYGITSIFALLSAPPPTRSDSQRWDGKSDARASLSHRRSSMQG